MDYFKKQLELLGTEREEDRQSYLKLTQSATTTQRRANGLCWYPIAIRGSELGKGDYLTVEAERTTHTDINHQLRFGASAVLFSNHDPQQDRIEGVVSYQSGNRLKLTLRTDELPDWARDGKLGIDVLFDDNSYEEMQQALKLADKLQEQQDHQLIPVLTGNQPATFDSSLQPVATQGLNTLTAAGSTTDRSG